MWLVLGMLIVIGAMGVFMHAIPTPWTEPAATALPTQRPTPVAVATAAPAAAASAPTTQVAAETTTVPTVGAQTQPAAGAVAIRPTIAPTSAPAVRPTSAATVVPAAEPTIEPTLAATVDPALAAEILPAYQRYWEVLDNSVATLDDSNLSAVMDGVELQATETYIDQLRNEGKAGVGPADHAVIIVSATPDEAVIQDKVVDHSIFVDPTTREPLPPDQQAATQNTEIDGTYYLRKIDGVWKVVNES
jgi:hypothetical protein